MEDLLTDFIAETREMLEALAGEIVAWEAAPGDRARLDAIFRFVHTVKGNSGFFDLPRLEHLSHAAEESLCEVRAGRRAADARLVSGVLGVIDRIGALVDGIESGDTPPPDDDRLIAALAPEAAGARTAAREAEVPTVQLRTPVRSVRISVDLLDRLMSGVSDMVLARNELSRSLRDVVLPPPVEGAFARVSSGIAELRDAITRTRMQRLDSLFIALPRLVRDLAAELGKEVRLEVEGGDVELDREMIELIRDPLTHMVRNAIDHGIESPAERTAAGKPPAGRLRVQASQSGNQILIEIGDDGRGIDSARLAERAVAAGIVDAGQAAAMSIAQKLALVFEPGFSTAGTITAISGRGVGMDVVRSNVERIGGIVEVDSTPGAGTRLALRVPLTLTIIAALTVAAGGQIFALPRSAVEEIVRCGGDGVRVERAGGLRFATVRDRRLPLIGLAAALGLDAAGEAMLIILRLASGGRYALSVDQVVDSVELVVKAASPAVMASGLYAGTTLADDGSPMLLLDPAGIATATATTLDLLSAADDAPAEPQAVQVEALLFRTLCGALRLMRLEAVERIEEGDAASVRFSAGRLRVTSGEAMLPLLGCEAPSPTGKFSFLRLSDGRAAIAYAFDEVIDIVRIDPGFTRAAEPGEIAGVALVGGEQVEIVDPYWLFAGLAGREKREAICAISNGDPWMENLLRPVLEGAGYAVVRAGEGAPYDILIVNADDASPPRSDAPTLRLRADPATSADDGSIHRYDHAGLLSALAEAARKRA